jgi:ATP/maltotriose-dependent transcriptional regulator MalT
VREAAAAASSLTRALALLVSLDIRNGEARRWLWLAGGRVGAIVALDLWDFGSWQALAARQVQVARDMGALVQLQLALNFLARVHILAGELPAARRLIEDRLITEATGNPPAGYAAMMPAAWQGREQEASVLIQSTAQLAAERGSGRLASLVACASAVPDNGLGRYDAARDAAREVFQRGHLALGHMVVAELAEAAARTGEVTLVRAALDWQAERTRTTPTEWALGIEARVRALLSVGEAADSSYRESIERLARTRVRAELARSHLLYGEWLRRQGRRIDARERLRTACDMLDGIGMEALADRARRELLATGETARKRTTAPACASGPSEALTAQETQVARLARDGLSNPEIGARLFISPRTAKYHLSNVFTKLGIASRSQLDRVLAVDADAIGPR